MTQLEAMRNHVEQLVAAGDVSAAIAMLRPLSAADPSNADLHQRLGELLARAGETDEALMELGDAAAAHAGTGNVLKAVATCQAILALDPRHTDSLRMLADLHAHRRGSAPPTPVAPNPSAGAAPPAALGRVGVRSVAVPAALANLPPVPLFSDLGRAAFLAVAARARLRELPADTVVVREGDMGESMFAVVSGTLGVYRGAAVTRAPLAELGEGAFFGEMALLLGTPRVATVAARTPARLLEFTRQDMADVIRQHASVGRALQKMHRARLLADLLRSSPLFRPFSQDERDELAAAFKSRAVPDGTVVLQQGQPSDAFYVLLRGQCVVTHRQGGSTRELARLHEGDVFGEIALLFNTEATATVQAVGACVVLRMARTSFERLVLARPEVRAWLTQLGTDRRNALATRTPGTPATF